VVAATVVEGDAVVEVEVELVVVVLDEDPQPATSSADTALPRTRARRHRPPRSGLDDGLRPATALTSAIPFILGGS
jgi:hypothetical protein